MTFRGLRISLKNLMVKIKNLLVNNKMMNKINEFFI